MILQVGACLRVLRAWAHHCGDLRSNLVAGRQDFGVAEYVEES